MTVTTTALATPPHPPWCGECHGDYDFVLHQTTAETVSVTPELADNPPSFVEVQMHRTDVDDAGPGEVLIRIDVTQAGTLINDHADMTPDQARKLAETLTFMANMADTADQVTREYAALLNAEEADR